MSKMPMKMAMKKYEGSAADMKADKAGAKKMAGKAAPAKGKLPAFLMGKKPVAKAAAGGMMGAMMPAEAIKPAERALS